MLRLDQPDLARLSAYSRSAPVGHTTRMATDVLYEAAASLRCGCTDEHEAGANARRTAAESCNTGWCAFAHLVGAAPGLRNPEPAPKFGAEVQIWRDSRAGSKRRSRAPSASGSDTTSLLTRTTFLRSRFGAAGPASKRRSRALPAPGLNTTIVHPGRTEKPTQGLKK